jgi:hypothetical protein
VAALAEPWNHLPLMWWVVLLLAVWSACDGVALPVVVFAGTLCQTRPYLSLAAGMGVVAAVLAALAWRARVPGGGGAGLGAAALAAHCCRRRR